MSNEKTAANQTVDNKAKEGKYLTFELGLESYGVEILKVQEIIGIMKVTHVPRMPDYVKGVINLRGKIIPVIDLRLKFGLESKAETDKTCIIVLQVNTGNKQLIMGILVDEVSEVVDIKKNQIEDAPSFGTTVDIDFIMGMGKVGNKVIMLLDVDKVLTKEEIKTLANAAKA
ncbi:MAG: hypothetical protein ACD_79C00020G0002 [uncultured bacterium]|nr:MAG: hypothetical protein ACD_79C00020G0002 [uncultured bacterium]